MKLEFTNNEIKEYSNGPFHVVNSGAPFDAPHGAATAFLAAKHPIGDELVNVFRPVEIDGNAAQDDTETPVETPESLAKANNRDALLEMAKEHGLDGDSYTNKLELATAILAVKGDQ
jgi:hypothetical protein